MKTIDNQLLEYLQDRLQKSTRLHPDDQLVNYIKSRAEAMRDDAAAAREQGEDAVVEALHQWADSWDDLAERYLEWRNEPFEI